MSKHLLLIPILGVTLSSCTMMNDAMCAMERNRQAIDMSTCAICENVRAIEQANRGIDQNRQKLEEINAKLGKLESL